MTENHKIYDFFISHSEEENDEAEQLCNILLQINPEWEIFFDKRCLGKENEWAKKMFEAAQYSKHLIFLAKSPETLEFRKRWVSKEVEFFYNLQSTGKRYGDGNLNISYFGIIYGWNMESDLFMDDEYGSLYRAMYTSPNHLIIGQNDSIADYCNSIKDKVLTMTAQGSNPMPSLILDRSFKYASVKENDDVNFKRELIIDSLIPNLSGDGGIVSFDEILVDVIKNDIAIVGTEGGIGKTTLMTKMFFCLLDSAINGKACESLIPIYIKGSALAGSNYLIMRYIAKNLFGEGTATTFDNIETGRIIKSLEDEFKKDTDKPNYVLLIDGYNEIPDGVLSKFNDEIKEYLDGSKYKNVRVVISGRYVGENFYRDNVIHYSIERIAFAKVRKYLDENGLTKTVSPALMNVLSIPMYLTMYVNMALEDKINTRAELLNSFVNRQLVKDEASADCEQTKACYHFFLKTLLPYIAYRLSVKDLSTGNFELTYNELLDIMADAVDYYNSREYKSRCGEDERKILRTIGMGNMDEFELIDLSAAYYTKVCKLLRVEQNGNDEKSKRFDFIHQVYRDFFAATYIHQDIQFCAKSENPCQSLEKEINEPDIVHLTIELLNEKSPYFDKESLKWNYDCNQSSQLIKLIENSRQNGQSKNPQFVSEAVKLLKILRSYDLSGCDFSELDLTKSNFCSAVMSRFDATTSYPSSFKNTKINIENIFINSHSTHIMAACTNDDTVAIYDASGTLKIWKKGVFDNNPLKIVTGLTFKIHKIIYSMDNKTIYGMAGHAIVEIQIPDGKFGYGEKVIYSSGKRLRNIFIDKSGELYFTTVFNSYNPKPLSNPDIADDVAFYGANSASAVRYDKMQAAFGYVAGYNGFKLYNFDKQSSEWKEVKLGVSCLLEEYVHKIEAYLKKSGLYKKFYNKRETDGKHYFNKLNNYRCVFFKSLVFKYCSEKSEYSIIPHRICTSVINKAKRENIPLDTKALKAINELTFEYKQKIAALEKENRALAYMHGRIISSMEYKPGTDILLVTYYNDYVSEKNNKHYYHTTVAELNTTDLSSKIIHTYTGHNKIRAIYSGDDIVIISSDKLWIVQNGGYVYSIPVIFSGTPHYFCCKEAALYYMVDGSAVYQLNSEFTCIKSFRHNFGNKALCMVVGTNNIPYLVGKNAVTKLWNDESKAISMFNIETGSREFVLERGRLIDCTKAVDDYFGKTIKDKLGKINLYNDQTICDSISLQRSLYVSECDFTGVHGTLSDPEYMKILSFYGATTDIQRKINIPDLLELDFTFEQSDTLFEEPEDVKNAVSPYVLGQSDYFKLVDERPNSYDECEIWAKIQKGSYKKDSLEPSDYSILERAYQLQTLTSEMVYYLMAAGLIEMPSVYSYEREKIAKRMHKTLFGNLHLLKKYIHPDGNMSVYTFDDLYGKTLLSGTSGGVYVSNPISNEQPAKICKNLVLNLWFSYTLMKYKDFVVKYDSEAMFESELTLVNKSKAVRRYIKLNNQAFFSRIIRGSLNESKIEKNKKHIEYFCKLASNYPYLLNRGVNEGLTKAPVIVIIGESFEYCQKLNNAFAHISPHIRKIYTYDTLLSYGMANDYEDIYFEFKDSEAYKLSLRDLI